MVGATVYVGGIPYDVRERDLERFFKGYGRTRDIMIKKGYAFVEFEDYRDADDAVYELNGKELLGERVAVELARGNARGRDRYDDRYRRSSRRYNDSKYKSSSRYNSKYGPPLRTKYRLIVENLSSRVSWQDLKDYMRKAGEVTYADAHKQRKNEAVVEFISYEDMKNAIEKLDGTELNGRKIRLIEDRPSHSRSRSHSRSKSYSRSRSRSRRRSHSRSSRSKQRKDDSKSPAGRSRSPRSRSRSQKSRNRDVSKSRSPHSRSHSHGADSNKRDSRSRSKSKHNKSNDSRKRSDDDRSKSRSKSRSRSMSNERNNGHSPDRNNESDG